MKTAIVLSTHNTGLGVIRALGKTGIDIIALYYETSDMGYVSNYVKHKEKIPHPEKNAGSFLDKMLNLSKDFKGSILIPADDSCLIALSKNKVILEQEEYLVACPDWEITQNVIIKKHTYEIASSLGIPIPKTLFPRNISDAEKKSEIVQYPCLIKPQISHQYQSVFTRKLTKVYNANELINEYKAAADAGLQVMIQEYIPGDDSLGVNYNSYISPQMTLIEFTAQKVRMSPPDSGVPRVVVSKSIPQVLESGRKILKAMNYNGYSCTEFKFDERDKKYKLLEVNGRHNRSTLLAVKCGINFPLIEYNDLVNNEIADNTSYSEGIYWIDFTGDIYTSIKFAFKEKMTLLQFIKPYLNKHIYAVWDIRDMKPFIKRCLDLVKTICKSLLIRS